MRIDITIPLEPSGGRRPVIWVWIGGVDIRWTTVLRLAGMSSLLPLFQELMILRRDELLDGTYIDPRGKNQILI